MEGYGVMSPYDGGRPRVWVKASPMLFAEQAIAQIVIDWLAADPN